MSEWTPKDRVEGVLTGGHADLVPMTIYESKFPQSPAERDLRNRGCCIVHRVGVIKTHVPNCRVSERAFLRDGKRMVEKIVETPRGTLTSLEEPAGFTTWRHERFFKSPDDYPALRFYLADEQFEPDYGACAAVIERLGGDGIVRANFGLEPMQRLISSDLMSTEQWCMEWMENRDEVLALYEIIAANRRRIYPLVANSPAGHANYGGNVTPEIIGLDVFEKYFLPHYAEAAEVMHAAGKLIGCHFDANCKLLAKAIAATDLDYIEAFTPAPDTDMTLADARAAWPDKALWINFPSSAHLKADREVEAVTLDLLDQAGSPDGLLLGITEDLPEHRGLESCRAIMAGIESHARLHPEHYR